jgi:hypothetical protein
MAKTPARNCRWLTDDGRCLGHPTPGGPEICEKHLALFNDWIHRRAYAIAQDMRPAIERQIRQELAEQRRTGRQPFRVRPARLNADDQELLDALMHPGAQTGQ